MLEVDINHIGVCHVAGGTMYTQLLLCYVSMTEDVTCVNMISAVIDELTLQ